MEFPSQQAATAAKIATLREMRRYVEREVLKYHRQLVTPLLSAQVMRLKEFGELLGTPILFEVEHRKRTVRSKPLPHALIRVTRIYGSLVTELPEKV